MTSISANSSIYYDSSLEFIVDTQKQNNRFKNAYVPKTFKWENQPVCNEDDEYEDDYSEPAKCCSYGYDVSGTIEMAYENGLEDHPGIKALESGGECVHPSDLEILLDELVTYPSEKSEEIDFSLKECKRLVSNMLSHYYGELKEIKEKVSLGDKYEEARGFCINKVLDFVEPLDIFTNKIN